MKIIAITVPKMIDEDAYLISNLLKMGIHSIHLRKPEATINECRQLLTKLTDAERAKIIIHDYPELYTEFSLKGIHINKNITSLPDSYNGFKTRSCHSFEEIERYKTEYDYLFLSPIFDSISKVGYKSGFTQEELLKASTSANRTESIIKFFTSPLSPNHFIPQSTTKHPTTKHARTTNTICCPCEYFI